MSLMLRHIIILTIGLSAIFLANDLYAQEYSDFNLTSKSAEPLGLEEATKLLESDPLASLDVLQAYLKNRSKSFTFEDQSRVYHLIGKANFKLNQFDLAINSYLRALDRGSSSYKRKRKIAPAPVDSEIYYDLSLAYGAKRIWSEAHRYALQHLRAVGKDDAPVRLSGLLNLGQVLLQLNDFDEAMKIVSEANLMADSIDDPKFQIESNYLLGLILEKSGQYDQALDNLNQAIVQSDSIDFNYKNKDISNAIGRTYRAKNDRENELIFKSQRRERSIEKNDLAQQNTLDLDIAELYIDLEQSEQAVPYLQESVALSEQLGDLEQNISARKSLSNVYASTNKYDLALNNYKSYVALVDELYINKQKEIELSTKIQQDLFQKQETIGLLEKDQQIHESEIQLLEKEKALQKESIALHRLFIYGLTLLIIVIMVSALLLYRNIQKKKLANQLLSLKSLRSQMNPHFIFNALNSVNSFISQNDTRKANKYLSDFSKLMRTVMENSQKDFVALTEEISVLELYLKLEHFRFQDKFDYNLTIKEEVSPDHLRIPPMLIQPFIENAIWHGLRYKKEHGQLSVLIDRNETSLILQIEDDGIGRKRSQELKTHNQKTQESTGMKNTESRINLLNTTYKSSITYHVRDMNDGDETGTHVSVMIPLELIEETI